MRERYGDRLELQALEDDLGLARALEDDRASGILLVGGEEIQAVRGLGTHAIHHVPVHVKPRHRLVLLLVGEMLVLVQADLHLTTVDTRERRVA